MHGIQPLIIEAMCPSDWPAVKSIFEQGIATGLATFDPEPPDWSAWDSSHLPECRLVARDLVGAVLGWAALSPTSRRKVYSGVAEVSIYVAETTRGRGVGKALLTALVAAADGTGFWTLQASIIAENLASRALHRACGFREVGYREKIGKVGNTWHDTILMERRSQSVLDLKP